MRKKTEDLIATLEAKGYQRLSTTTFHCILRSKNGLWIAVITVKLGVVEYYHAKPGPKGAPRK